MAGLGFLAPGVCVGVGSLVMMQQMDVFRTLKRRSANTYAGQFELVNTRCRRTVLLHGAPWKQEHPLPKMPEGAARLEAGVHIPRRDNIRGRSSSARSISL